MAYVNFGIIKPIIPVIIVELCKRWWDIWMLTDTSKDCPQLYLVKP